VFLHIDLRADRGTRNFRSGHITRGTAGFAPINPNRTRDRGSQPTQGREGRSGHA